MGRISTFRNFLKTPINDEINSQVEEEIRFYSNNDGSIPIAIMLSTRFLVEAIHLCTMEISQVLINLKKK